MFICFLPISILGFWVFQQNFTKMSTHLFEISHVKMPASLPVRETLSWTFKLKEDRFSWTLFFQLLIKPYHHKILLRKAGKGLSQDEVKIEVMIYVKQLPKHITSLKVVWHPKLYLNKRHISQIIAILWQQYTLPYLHVAEVCATKCGLHCEAVCNSHLAPHDNTCCRLLALAYTELAPTERELVRSLGQRNHILLKEGILLHVLNLASQF